jgi:hypothetical protein
MMASFTMPAFKTRTVNKMKAHDRIWKALCHEEPDRVPTFTQSIEDPFVRRFDDAVGIEDEAGLSPDVGMDMVLARQLGFDSKWIHLHGSSAPARDFPAELPPMPADQSVSKTGQIHVRSKDGSKSWYYDGALKTPELVKAWIPYIKDFTVPDASYYKIIKKMWDAGCAKDIVPIPTAGAPTMDTWASIGMRRFSYMTRKHPELVERLINTWCDVVIEEHHCIFEAGIPYVFICDDHAQKERLMMSPTDWERFVEPVYQRLANNARKHGAKFLVHTDGNLNESFPGMYRAGVDAAEPLEYEAGMRLKSLKEKYGDKITLIGNVPSSDALCLGSVEFTIEMTKQCIKDAAAGGGLILAPGANILASAKIENVKAMIETNKKYGVYPIDF